MTKSKYPPILFNTEMVKAILENRKKQTRRLLQPQPYKTEDFIIEGLEEKIKGAEILRHPKRIKYDGIFKSQASKLWPAKYQIGDVLWVRETWIHWNGYYQYKPLPFGEELGKWKSSIHMPKEAARIFLKVTNVRCERIIEISCEDCKKEGVNYHKHENKDVDDFLALEAFMELWQSINGKDSWEQNPYVWVYDFEQVEKPADFLS